MTRAKTKSKQSAPGRDGGLSAALEEITEECLGVRVRILSRTLTRVYDAELRPHGLTAAQLNLLAAIGGLEPARAGEVAELLSMEISTLSRNAHLLQREGWVTIQRAEHGNRRLLSLTAEGARRLEAATPAWRRAQKKARTLLGKDGAKVIRDLVDEIWAEQTTAS